MISSWGGCWHRNHGEPQWTDSSNSHKGITQVFSLSLQIAGKAPAFTRRPSWPFENRRASASSSVGVVIPIKLDAGPRKNRFVVSVHSHRRRLRSSVGRSHALPGKTSARLIDVMQPDFPRAPDCARRGGERRDDLVVLGAEARIGRNFCTGALQP